MPFFIGFGAFEYDWATGFKKFWSKDSLNSKVTLFISSKGSFIFSAYSEELNKINIKKQPLIS